MPDERNNPDSCGKENAADASFKAMKHQRIAESEDNDGIGFEDVRPMRIGYVDYVNGPEAAECPAYIPDENELARVRAFLATIARTFGLNLASTEVIGSAGMQMSRFTQRVLSLAGASATSSIQKSTRR